MAEFWTKKPAEQKFELVDADNVVYVLTVIGKVTSLTKDGISQGSITFDNAEIPGPQFIKNAFTEIGALIVP